MHGPACIFWANLTPFSLQLLAATQASDDVAVTRLLAGGADPNTLVPVWDWCGGSVSVLRVDLHASGRTPSGEISHGP